METTSKMAAAQETGLRDDEPARSTPGSNLGHAVGVATPRISVNVDDNRQARSITNVKAQVDSLSFYYGQNRALKNLSIPIADKQVTALIGPSGCGKSTFLRCFTRMHDLQPDTRYEGSITLHPDNINLIGPGIDPIEVRMRIGMVFQ